MTNIFTLNTLINTKLIKIYYLISNNVNVRSSSIVMRICGTLAVVREMWQQAVRVGFSACALNLHNYCEQRYVLVNC